jgi:hypothetical protein
MNNSGYSGCDIQITSAEAPKAVRLYGTSTLPMFEISGSYWTFSALELNNMKHGFLLRDDAQHITINGCLVASPVNNGIEIV